MYDIVCDSSKITDLIHNAHALFIVDCVVVKRDMATIDVAPQANTIIVVNRVEREGSIKHVCQLYPAGAISRTDMVCVVGIDNVAGEKAARQMASAYAKFSIMVKCAVQDLH